MAPLRSAIISGMNFIFLSLSRPAGRDKLIFTQRPKRIAAIGGTLSGANAPDSLFCRCTTSSPGAGEVFPQRGSLWRNRILCVDCQGLSLWERWHCASNDGEGEVAVLRGILQVKISKICNLFLQKYCFCHVNIV